MIVKQLDIIVTHNKELKKFMEIPGVWSELDEDTFIFMGDWELDLANIEVKGNLKEIWIDWSAEH